MMLFPPEAELPGESPQIILPESFKPEFPTSDKPHDATITDNGKYKNRFLMTFFVKGTETAKKTKADSPQQTDFRHNFSFFVFLARINRKKSRAGTRHGCIYGTRLIKRTLDCGKFRMFVKDSNLEVIYKCAIPLFYRQCKGFA